jgi:hypothetical protein
VKPFVEIAPGCEHQSITTSAGPQPRSRSTKLPCRHTSMQDDEIPSKSLKATAWMYDDWRKASTEIDADKQGLPGHRSRPLSPDRECLPGRGPARGHPRDRIVRSIGSSKPTPRCSQPIPGRACDTQASTPNTPTEHALSLMADLQRRFDVGQEAAHLRSAALRYGGEDRQGRRAALVYDLGGPHRLLLDDKAGSLEAR